MSCSSSSSPGGSTSTRPSPRPRRRLELRARRRCLVSTPPHARPTSRSGTRTHTSARPRRPVTRLMLGCCHAVVSSGEPSSERSFSWKFCSLGETPARPQQAICWASLCVISFAKRKCKAVQKPKISKKIEKIKQKLLPLYNFFFAMIYSMKLPTVYTKHILKIFNLPWLNCHQKMHILSFSTKKWLPSSNTNKLCSAMFIGKHMRKFAMFKKKNAPVY